MLGVLGGNDHQPPTQHLRGEAGTETVRVDLEVFGWPSWRVGLPAGDTIVPQIRTVAGVRVTSTSHLRMARTSPIRELCGVPDKERDLAAGQQRRAALAADSP
jgi:hypothetical protein